MIKKGGTVVEISIITINIQSYTNNLVYIIITLEETIHSPCNLKQIPSSLKLREVKLIRIQVPTGASKSGFVTRLID